MADLFYLTCKNEVDTEVPPELQTMYERASELEELIQGNALHPAITAGVEFLTDQDIAALRGLWRGRNRAEREKAEKK